MNTLALSGLSFVLLQSQPGAGSFIAQLLPLFLIFVVFYLLVIRPQQKKQQRLRREREQMLNALKPADKVVTTGGVFGTIVAVRDDSILLRIAQSVSVEIERTAVARLQSQEAKETDS